MRSSLARNASFAPGAHSIRTRRSRAGRTTTPARASASAAELQTEYGIADSVEIVEGDAGLVKCVLTHANGSSAEVYLFGACVTSWCQPSGDDVLYVRPDAVFDGSKPISGGVPLCFPQFGPGEMQQHGFARNLEWELVGSSADVNPDFPEPAVLLKLTESEYTKKMWPYSFDCVYEVTLRRDALQLELKVRNSNEEPFSFTGALHSYIEVTDAASEEVCVTGLQGKTFLDKVPDPEAPVEKTQEADTVTFGKALVDSVYLDTDGEALLEVGTGAAVVVSHLSGWTDHVVWNPHETMPACWNNFVCVESALVGAPHELAPGEVWTGTTSLSVVDL